MGENITVVEAGKELDIKNVRIKAVEAYNIEKGNTTKVAHKKGIGIGYIIHIGGKSIYHAGDTDLIPEMEDIGKISIAFLPIGGRNFTMNVTDAVQAAITINPQVVIPMHHSHWVVV